MDQQAAWANVARSKSYSSKDFEAFTDEQLDAYESEGRAWQDSSVNFNDAVRQAKYERMLSRRRGGSSVQTLGQPAGSPGGGIRPREQQPPQQLEEETEYIPEHPREMGAPDQQQQQTVRGAKKVEIPDWQRNATQIGVPTPPVPPAPTEPEVDLDDISDDEEAEMQTEYQAQEKEESGEGVYEESEVEIADKGDIA